MAGTSLPAVPTAMKMSKSQPALDAAPAASLKPSPSLPALPAAGGGQPGAPSAAIDDDESTLDGETLAEETIDATFLTGADDDASFLSQSSVRSYPEHPYALPNTMPHLCKPEDREVRVRQRRSHQGEVRRRREKLRKDATDNVVRSLEEHARRVEERRLRGVRLERGRKWLALIARVAAHDWAEQSLRGAEELRARKARQARFEEKKNESATVIQHAMRNALLRSGHSVLREFWQKMAKFSAKVNPQRWRCQLQIRCWRRKSAVALLKMFLQEGLTHRGTQAVLNFMAKVRRLQRMAFDWLQARAKRKELLRQIWDDCESILRAELEAVSKEAWNPLAVENAGKGPKKKGLKLKERPMADRINDDIVKLKKIEDGMNALVQRQLKAGVPVSGASSAHSDVPGIPAPLRDSAIEDIFNEICRMHANKHGDQSGMLQRSVNQLNPREFTKKDVLQILALSSTKGHVHKIREKDIYQQPSDVERYNIMHFFTAFSPLSLHEKVTEIWIQVYNTQNAPIANMYLNTIDLEGRKAATDANKKGRRGALRLHKAEHGRRKGTVGSQTIDVTRLDVSNVETGYNPNSPTSPLRKSLSSSFGSVDDVDAARAAAARRGSMPGQILAKGARAGGRDGMKAVEESRFNSRASQIVSSHLARCALMASDLAPLESTKRRESMAIIKMQKSTRQLAEVVFVNSPKKAAGDDALGARAGERRQRALTVL